jgi:hygromycin-B 7''-O-kinase
MTVLHALRFHCADSIIRRRAASRLGRHRDRATHRWTVERRIRVRVANADPLIVKQYASRWRWKQAKEVHGYRLLAKHGIGPMPRVVHVDRERSITVLTMLPGTPPSETALPPEAAHTTYRQMGRFLASLHRITLPAYAYMTTTILDPMPDNTTHMSRQFTKKLSEFTALRGGPELHDTVRAHVAARKHLFSCRRGVRRRR